MFVRTADADNPSIRQKIDDMRDNAAITAREIEGVLQDILQT
jgi:hypothetical protein